MSLNYPDEPDDAPSDAQFYGPETDSFVAGWYKYKDGQWYWSQKIHGSRAVWQEVSSYNIPTLGTDIFIVKTFPLEALQPDAEYLYHTIPNVQLRREENTGYSCHPNETQWGKLTCSLDDGWWLRQIPLANLGWEPCSPSSAITPENDVDNW